MLKNIRKILATAFILLAVFFITTGLGIKDTDTINEESEKIELEYWRVAFDTPEDFDNTLNTFEDSRGNIKVTLKTFTYDEYEKEVLKALATGKGPDIISVHNDEALTKYLPYLYPMPASYKMIVSKSGMTPGCKSQEVVTQPLYTSRTFKEQFVEAAETDCLYENMIFAVPLYMDTLALFYNKDLFNSAGIETPPKTWTEFQENVQTLTDRSSSGSLVKPGAAIGTANNINRSVDILQLLMLQNGTEMTSSEHNMVTFDHSIHTEEGNYYPGSVALEFYTDFANPEKTVYTWDAQQKNSIDAFSNGDVAMIFNYSYQIPLIRARSPHLNFGVSTMPQIEGNTLKANLPNYFVEAVSSQSENPEEAWELLYFLTQAENNEQLLESMQRPPAIRELTSSMSETEISNIPIAPFLEQSLTAQSWYKIDNLMIERIFGEMLTNTLSGIKAPQEAVEDAASAINIETPSSLPIPNEQFLITEDEAETIN